MPTPRRLKVLISAYACEPNKGSEPEVGWQWALQMARFHDVTVLTRSNNQPAIERELALLPPSQPRPGFVYHDRSPALLRFKKELRAHKLYYLLWQRSARDVVAQLHAMHGYDLVHHVTFAGFRYPTAIWGHGIPSIWGPVGGIESIPFRLLPWHHPESLVVEVGRGINNLMQLAPMHILPQRARATTTILASTAEMRQVFTRMDATVQVMPTIGLNTRAIPRCPHEARTGPLKLLFAGNIITLKGVDLALSAFAEAKTDATFTLIGDGNYLNAGRRLVHKLGLTDRVIFRGRVPRNDLVKLYAEYDMFLFPSLHDTGGYAVIEAMLQGLPVICLNCGGPAMAVEDSCGIKVNLGSRKQVVAQLAGAIRTYDQDRERLRRDGAAARESIIRNYDWEQKGVQMNAVYTKTARSAESSPAGAVKSSGIGSMPQFLHGMFSFRGLMITLLCLLIVGALGFFSINKLRESANRIVTDTLPGLSIAGKANASLAEAFNRSVLLVTAQSHEEQVEIARQMEDFSQQTSTLWEQYQKQVFTVEEQNNMKQLLEERRQYLEVRKHLLDLISNNRQPEAAELLNKSLLPAYVRYRDQGNKLLEYNMKESRDRGHAIMQICTITQIFVALIAMFLFVAGFLFGFFR